MTKSCRTCHHHSPIKNSANIYCTHHNVIISAENDLDCPDHYQAKPQPTPSEIRYSMLLFCASHDHCSGCPYRHLNDQTQCIIQFTIDQML